MGRIQSLISIFKRPLFLLPFVVLIVACGNDSLFEEQDSHSKAVITDVDVVDYLVTEDDQKAQLLVKANLEVQLDPALISAALRGVPLYFVYEMRITEPKWFFFEKDLAYQSQQWLIQYQPLLRQWSVKTKNRISQEISLDDSLEHISNDNTMRLSLEQSLEDHKTYEAQYRLRLDTTQLPGAFQFDLFNFRSVWSLSSEWQKLTFQISTLKSND